MKLSNAQSNKNFLGLGYDNVKQLDSLQKFGPEENKLSDWEYNIIKKALIVAEKNTKKEMLEKFLEQARNNFPKALFIYMPIFAFVLWLFHGKKRWYYFDHGIFTLHYFSFLLLTVLLFFFFGRIMNCFADNAVTTSIKNVGNFSLFAWMFYYFFPAHHRFYGETRTISFLKSIVMFFINVILISIVLTVFVIYTFINIH